jgi:hypothetical protein
MLALGTRIPRHLVGALAALACCALSTVAAPGIAHAETKFDGVQMNQNAFLHLSWIRFDASDNPVQLTVTEAADGASVTLTDTTLTAAGQFEVTAPCAQTSITTAVCPTTFNGLPVGYVWAIGGGDNNNFTFDVPTLAVQGSFGSGTDTVRIVHNALTPRMFAVNGVSLGDGNDTFIGGPGPEEVYPDQGTDTVNVFNNPAAADIVHCSIPAVEGPIDTVIVDAADTVTNNTNCMVRPGR